VPIPCLVLSDGSKYIAAQISRFFISNNDINPIQIEEIKKDTMVKVYPLKTVIDNLRPRFLKELANEGLSDRIDKAIDERDNPQERELSEFDKALLKALKYNPKEREKQI
jgi:hypothetical protein